MKDTYKTKHNMYSSLPTGTEPGFSKRGGPKLFLPILNGILNTTFNKSGLKGL
jgi:hypothetical protein